ncbi:Fibrinogen-like protein A,Ryncolin-2,Angiopoietin-1,Angiopoietin-related protein 6,Angiopoietin-related protein 2,Microfibril-associated glycoprotein 4,Angiopoietin-related protein 7,Angiopoietin-related protein 1,Ficolin-2,Ryncolin-1,Ryncolin-3,Ficolin-1,Fibrinogen C domain-containing protein 1 [Mytilus coruscus]|uniref:Fibrinogen C-terminal domain-containing protein n=1 Tax=Mytilus coruscus TaxID=42192 RepID=A0A6J8B6B7_MYTCO|nr:Fibrinogen-like protein A,Ryncolin-2,Angiopoietin-1,Angiopoietin-related protein 6,Angiopoietin-related protein 2,Microfibril-associated glycoprotein 4,Angiopoietin-related protein 7,Angiopoietin-related protein 1,Ficolin-2,Ryncolin-1,Ryncolin-3,Ficolin-1,Fibrinogen C domain-containing protein 1 [Mytilus coruscus]
MPKHQTSQKNNGKETTRNITTKDNHSRDCKRICYSCTNLQENEKCLHAVQCQNDEVCFTQKYQTNENATRYDVGCTYPEICRKDLTGNLVGRRSDHSHMICQKCCNGSHVCNDDQTCDNSLIGKSINEECEESKQCKLTLQCRNKKCQCIESNYWTGSTCAERKSVNGTCATLMECRDTLFCVHGKCRCDYFIGETWDGYSCGTGHSINGSCTTASDCRTTLSCINGKCSCNSSESWNGHACVTSPRECEDLIISASGIYIIYPGGGNLAVQVYCVVEGNKIWTVIQRRESGSVDFDRGWNEYKSGFGIAGGDYWLGNENIHIISMENQHEISIYLEVSPSDYRYANYSTFRLGDENSKYSLTIAGYGGNAGDSMHYHNGLMFSTKDADHDLDGGRNCAARYKGGWWYNSCYYANLNREDNNLINWRTYSNYIRKTKMMIRRKP